MPPITSGVCQLFLSCVTKEFRSHREQLAQDLNLPHVKVQVQEDFIQGGSSTLAKLNGYIKHCAAVIHLVGSGTGNKPKATEIAVLLLELPKFISHFPFLKDKDRLASLSYTQWEAWLAIYHDVPCYIYRAEPSAVRAPGFVEGEQDKQLQEEHWERFREYGKDRKTFQSEDELCRLVLRSLSTILPGGVHKSNVVPKGLRSFDANDAAFFLDLLPGLHDEHNLPKNIRYWKHRIEARDEATFTVGVIYGPSGCGKSSLVKAGLLPRLAPQITSVYVEATANGTEARLLKGLQRRYPTLTDDLNLSQSLTALRQENGPTSDSKLVLFIDQFEQWLHARRIDQTTELVQALRQCDGERVQCVLIVRDDFWSALSRFVNELNVLLNQDQNSVFVDLFDQIHAENVLAAFGRGYGRLDADPTAEQTAFMKKAVDELSQNGRVISVRLALFAEMVKGKPWVPKTLKEIGGIEGVGFTFLEETFVASTADPNHRRHQKAAQNVLKALLPETGTDIKGHMQSHQQLLEASGYTGRSQDFDDLLRILDSELRLITPTNPESPDQEPNAPEAPVADQRYYQLTHDYLVPSIRDWHTHKQRETWRGRAELALVDRAIQWTPTRERRYFPSILEFLAIQLGVPRHRRSRDQRRLMRAATRWYGFHTLLILLTLGSLTWLTSEISGHIQGKQLVAQIGSAVPGELPRMLDQDLPAYRRWADPLLRKALKTGEGKSGGSEPAPPASTASNLTHHIGLASPGTIRLHASLALLDVDESQTEYLAERLLDCSFDEFPIVRDRLRKSPARTEHLQKTLWPIFRGTGNPVARTSEGLDTVLKARLRAGMALATWSPPEDWTEPDDIRFLAERLTAENPIHQAVLLDALRPLATQLVPLLEARFRDGTLREAERVAAAQALLDYAATDVRAIAMLLVDAEPAQYEILFPLAIAQRDAMLPHFQEIAADRPGARLKEVERIELGKRRAGAAVTLMRLNDPVPACNTLEVLDDPEALTQFAHRQRPRRVTADQLLDDGPNGWVQAIPGGSPRGVTPDQLLDALELVLAPSSPISQSPTIRFGLIIALGEFPFDDIPEPRRERLIGNLEGWYRTDPRSAIHGASGWLLRKWGKTRVVTEVDHTALEYHPKRDWFVDVVRGEFEGQPFEDAFTFVTFPAHEFEMGSPPTENARSVDEERHHVRLTRPIAVCDRELTVEQWRHFERATEKKAKLDDNKSQSPAHPMNSVTWYGAVHYCRWLTTMAGGKESDQCYDDPAKLNRADKAKPDSELDDCPFHLERGGYRLPTEAEWEYASRSGLRSSYGFGSDRALLPLYANYLDTSNDKTRIGGGLRPNGRGVFDMHGNILEWCHDWKADYAITDEPDPHGPDRAKTRVLRGGSWSSAGRDCRSADRHDYAPEFAGHRVGFRLAKVPGSHSPVAETRRQSESDHQKAE